MWDGFVVVVVVVLSRKESTLQKEVLSGRERAWEANAEITPGRYRKKIVLGDLEWRDKKFILNLVDIEELGSVWAGYCQSYNLGRLIGLQNVALEREKAADQWKAITMTK